MVSGLSAEGGGGRAPAVAPEEAWHLIRGEACRVARFQLADLLIAGIGTQRPPFVRGMGGQCPCHRRMMGRMGDRSASTGLHPVRGLVGQGVPHGRRVAVHPADHDRAAAVVVQALETRLVAIALDHPGPSGAEQTAQAVDVGPGGSPGGSTRQGDGVSGLTRLTGRRSGDRAEEEGAAPCQQRASGTAQRTRQKRSQRVVAARRASFGAQRWGGCDPRWLNSEERHEAAAISLSLERAGSADKDRLSGRPNRCGTVARMDQRLGDQATGCMMPPPGEESSSSLEGLLVRRA